MKEFMYVASVRKSTGLRKRAYGGAHQRDVPVRSSMYKMYLDLFFHGGAFSPPRVRALRRSRGTEITQNRIEGAREKDGVLNWLHRS